MKVVFLDEQPDLIYPGHSACPGCGAALAVKLLTRAAGPRTALVITASCWSIITGSPPFTSARLPLLHAPFGGAAAVGSGLKRGMERKGDRETMVVVLAGDGGTFDIGLQGLSGAAARNENILFVCYDNEAYMNTGVQSSTASPQGAITNTAPAPRRIERKKKDIMAIMAAHGVPYAATATVAFPADLAAKVQEARRVRGFRFLHILSPCPPGWGSEPDLTVELSRLAVESRLFPLYEVRAGTGYCLTHRPAGDAGLAEYLRLQRRYAGLTAEQTEYLRRQVQLSWERLLGQEAGQRLDVKDTGQ